MVTGTQCITRDNSQKVNNANLCAKLWHGYNKGFPGNVETRRTTSPLLVSSTRAVAQRSCLFSCGRLHHSYTWYACLLYHTSTTWTGVRSQVLLLLSIHLHTIAYYYSMCIRTHTYMYAHPPRHVTPPPPQHTHRQSKRRSYTKRSCVPSNPNTSWGHFTVALIVVKRDRNVSVWEIDPGHLKYAALKKSNTPLSIYGDLRGY